MVRCETLENVEVTEDGAYLATKKTFILHENEHEDMLFDSDVGTNNVVTTETCPPDWKILDTYHHVKPHQFYDKSLENISHLQREYRKSKLTQCIHQRKEAALSSLKNTFAKDIKECKKTLQRSGKRSNYD